MKSFSHPVNQKQVRPGETVWSRAGSCQRQEMKVCYISIAVGHRAFVFLWMVTPQSIHNAGHHRDCCSSLTTMVQACCSFSSGLNSSWDWTSGNLGWLGWKPSYNFWILRYYGWKTQKYLLIKLLHRLSFRLMKHTHIPPSVTAEELLSIQRTKPGKQQSGKHSMSRYNKQPVISHVSWVSTPKVMQDVVDFFFSIDTYSLFECESQCCLFSGGGIAI